MSGLDDCFIRNLHLDTSEEELLEAINKFGPIAHMTLLPHKDSQSKRVAYATFENECDREEALKIRKFLVHGDEAQIVRNIRLTQGNDGYRASGESRASLPPQSMQRQSAPINSNHRFSLGQQADVPLSHNSAKSHHHSPLLSSLSINNLVIAFNKRTGLRQVKKLEQELNFQLIQSSLTESIELAVTKPTLTTSLIESASSNMLKNQLPQPSLNDGKRTNELITKNRIKSNISTNKLPADTPPVLPFKTLSNQYLQHQKSRQSEDGGCITNSTPQVSTSKMLSTVSPTKIKAAPIVKVPIRKLSATGDKVEIIHMDSLRKFTVKVLSVEAEYSRMMQEINLTSGGVSNLCTENVFVGQHCLGRWHEDNQWYRVEVLAVLQSMKRFKVFFMDEGNTEEVGLESLQPLNASYAQLPRLLVHCALKDVNDNELVNVKQLLMNEVGRAVAYGLELIADDSSVQNVRLILIAGNLEELLSPISAGLTKISQLLKNNSQVEDVFVMSFIDSQQFVVQFSSLSSSYVKLSTQLNEKKDKIGASPIPGSSHLQVGNFMLARWQSDMCWYRVELLEQINATVWRVFFIDEGYEDCLANTELRYLSNQLVDLPQVSQMCALEGFEKVVVDSAALNQIKKLLEECNNFATIQFCKLAVVSNGRFVASVQMKAGTVNVCDYLSEIISKSSKEKSLPLMKQLQQSSSSVSVVSGQPENFRQDKSLLSELVTPSQCIMSNIVVSLAKGDQVHVVIGFYKSYSEVWLQETSRLDEFKELTLLLNNCAKKPIVLNRLPSVGEMVASLFTDNLYYRARVVEIVNKGACLLHFVDYGNYEVTLLEKMCLLPKELHKEQPFALKAALAGNISASLANEEAVSKIVNDLINEGSVFRLIKLEDTELPPRAHLQLGNGVLLNEYLAQKGVLYECVIPEPEPFMSNLDVIVMAIPDVRNIFVIPNSNKTLLENMNHDMKKEYETSTPSISLKNVSVGQVYAALSTKYPGDWYRAKIVAIRAAGRILVNFVDYAESEELHVDALRPLSAERASVNALVTAVRMMGVGECQPGALEWLTEKVSAAPGSILRCEVVQNKEPVLVRLFANNTDLGQGLLKAGFAAPSLPVEDLAQRNRHLREALASEL